MEWRPIDSAPKDGTVVEMLAVNGERVQPLAWMWSPNAQCYAWCGVVQGIILPHNPQPTHWMPLPPPPGEAPAADLPVRNARPRE